VVLTTYATLLRLEWARAQPWGLVVLDEAQAIKNAEAKQTRAVKALKSRHRLILTGTPVENSLVDLWSCSTSRAPVCSVAPPTSRRFVAASGAITRAWHRCAGWCGPYILRRMKTDRRIIADLPEKTEMRSTAG
jgi:non-specific serine/threonine protein kinase